MRAILEQDQRLNIKDQIDALLHAPVTHISFRHIINIEVKDQRPISCCSPIAQRVRLRGRREDADGGSKRRLSYPVPVLDTTTSIYYASSPRRYRCHSLVNIIPCRYPEIKDQRSKIKLHTYLPALFAAIKSRIIVRVYRSQPSVGWSRIMILVPDNID